MKTFGVSSASPCRLAAVSVAVLTVPKDQTERPISTHRMAQNRSASAPWTRSIPATETLGMDRHTSRLGAAGVPFRQFAGADPSLKDRNGA